VKLDNIVAWNYDKKGIFLVRSAYKVQRAHEKRSSKKGVASSSTGVGTDRRMWKELWGLKWHGKIRYFIWRFAHNSLAVRRNLERRGMEVDTWCVLCNSGWEDGGHLFFNCKHVKHVWQALGLEEKKKGVPRANIICTGDSTLSTIGGGHPKVVFML